MKACSFGKQLRCKQVQVNFGAGPGGCVAELEFAWICDKEEWRAGFVLGSTRALPP